MKKPFQKFKIFAAGFLLFFCSLSSLNGQWGFTAQDRLTGSCDNYYLLFPQPIPIYGFATKQQCESVRQFFVNYRITYDRCVVYVSCTPCTGSDIAIPQYGTPGSISIDGPASGRSTFSLGYAQSVHDWMDEVHQKMQAFRYGDGANIFSTSGNTSYEKTYANLVHELPKYERVNMPEWQAFLPERPNMGRMERESELRRQMERLLKEINQIDRFCASQNLNCMDYQEKKRELERQLNDTKNELKELSKGGYDEKIEQYRREIAQYEKYLSECQNKICENAMRKGLSAATVQLAEAEASSKAESNRIDNFTYREPEMSYAQKQCEIAYEMKERGDKIGGQRLLDMYTPIVAIENGAKIFKEGMRDEYVRKSTVDFGVDAVGFTTDLASFFSSDNGTVRDALKSAIKKTIASDVIKGTAGTGDIKDVRNMLENSLVNSFATLAGKIPVIGKSAQAYTLTVSGVETATSGKKAFQAWWDWYRFK